MKIYVSLLSLVAFSTTMTLNLASDYNGNLLRSNKVVLNNNSTNSYIQSIMNTTINFDGLLDQNFGGTVSPLGTTYIPSSISGAFYINDFCTGIAIQSDGKIVLCGYTSDLNRPPIYFAAARFLPNGQPDLSFGGQNGARPGTMYIPFSISGVAEGHTMDQCNSLAIQSDGKIVMGGSTQTSSGSPDYNVSNQFFAAARLNSDGTLDTTFNAAGVNNTIPGTMYIPAINNQATGTDVCRTLALDQNENIILGGNTSSGPGPLFAAARIIGTGPDAGTLDTTFNAAGLNNATPGTMYILGIQGEGSYSLCNTLGVDTNNNIVMGGWSSANGNINFSAARVLGEGSNAGTLDPTFNPTGQDVISAGIACILNSISGYSGNFTDNCTSIALQSDGKIIMAGFSGGGQDFSAPTSPVYFAAARLTAAGMLDETFGNNPTGPTGTMYIPFCIGGTSNPDYIKDSCYSITIQPDDKIIMGGSTVTGNNGIYTYFAAARLTPSGTLDQEFGGTNSPKGTLYVPFSIWGSNNNIYDQCKAIILQNNHKIVMGGITSDGNGQPYFFGLAQLINPMTLKNYQASYTNIGAGLYS